MRTRQFDFMGRRGLATAVSTILVVASLAGLVVRGLNFGIEFTGGALFEVRFSVPVDLERIRAELSSGGFGEALVQRSGSEHGVMIRVPAAGHADVGTLNGALLARLARVHPDPVTESSEVIGPAVGDELRDSAGLAALASLATVGVYIMFRFAGKFALGATVALVHDVIVTLGAFVALGLTFDMPAFAAVLAIIGYSLNDTIVVYDRVRENLRRMRAATPEHAINTALNQTLERTLAMSGTTLFTVLALLIFGGPALRSFSVALTAGVVVGTYSSIYVASSLLLALDVDRLSLVPPETVDEADRP